MEDDFEKTALDYQDTIAAMSDAEILQAYEATDGDPDSPWQSALAVALQERGVDF
jgi:hypothetical protein